MNGILMRALPGIGPMPVLILFFTAVFGYNGTSLADTAPVEEQKIQLEKAHIIGAVERPGTFYSVPWQNPEIQEKVNFEFNRSFKKEILEFIDRDEILRRQHGVAE